MISREYNFLIEKLLSSTLKRHIKWDVTSSAFKYKVKIGLETITIEKDLFRNSEITTNESYRISIINNEGKETSSTTVIKNSFNIEEYTLLNKLYKAASESSLNLDDTVKSILEELDRIDGESNQG